MKTRSIKVKEIIISKEEAERDHIISYLYHSLWLLISEPKEMLLLLLPPSLLNYFELKYVRHN